MHFCLSSLMHRQWKRVLLPYRELKWQSRLQEANWRIILIDLMPTPSSSEKENDKSLKDSSECSLTTITVFVKSYRSFHLPFEPRFFRFKLFREWLNQNRWKLGNSTGWERTWPIPRSQWEIKQSTRFGGISFEFWWFTIGNSNQFRRLLNWRWWSCGRACSTPSGCQISLLYKRHWLLFLATLLTLTFPFILGFWLPNGLFILVVHFLLLEDDGPWVEWVRSFPDW